MINIAIVEDKSSEADRLKSCLDRFQTEKQEPLQYFLFQNAVSFLDQYRAQYDIIFMDIEMPDMNGMEAAQRLRAIDNSSILIFVTHLAQFAVKGYEVDAMDYILKPVNYPALAIKLQRAISRRRSEEGQELLLTTNSGVLRLRTSSLKYVEIYNHHIFYHTEQGDFSAYGTLKQVEKQLPSREFFRCSSSCIVNLRHVTEIDGLNVTVDGKVLSISRLKRKEFMEELHQYCSGKVTG